MKTYAPIALFVYNRYDHVKKVVNAIKKNSIAKKSKIYVFSDFSETDKEQKKIKKIRKYLKKINGFKKISIIERKKNYGTSKNITTGLNYIFKTYDKCIIIEDDILVSTNFLYQINYFLNKYNLKDKIASVEGHMYPVPFDKNISEYYFIRGAGCWGWGTWKKSWKNYEKSAQKLINKFNKNKNLIRDFNYNNSYPYYKMLLKQLNTKKESWAIKWYASNFLKENYTLYFKNSLVKNIGLDGTGVNCKIDYNINQKKFLNKKINIDIKKKLKEDSYAKSQISKFLKNKFKFSKKLILIIKHFF